MELRDVVAVHMAEEVNKPPLTTRSADSEARPRERIRWLDVTRGIGIILVVYGHAIRGQIANHAYPPTPAIMLQDAAIYAFHMPLFFFLSGLFVGPLARSNSRDIAVRLFWNIAYPYFLWSIIQISLNIAATRWVNTPFQIDDLFGIAWRPVGQFWFLYALLLFQLLLFVPRPLFYAIAFAACFFTPMPSHTILSWASPDLPYFAAGVWLTAARTTKLLESRGRATALGLGAIVIFALGLWVYPGPVLHGWSPLRLVIASGGIVTTLAVGRMLAPVGAALTHLGRASMPIFLMHVIAAAALRTALAMMPAVPPPLALFLVTAFGLFAPYIVAVVAARWGVNGWLGFGGRPRGRLGVA